MAVSSPPGRLTVVARRSYNPPDRRAASDDPARIGSLETERQSLIATLGRSADRRSAQPLIWRLTMVLGALAGFEESLLDQWSSDRFAEQLAAEKATVRIEHLRRGGNEEHDD